MVDAYVEFGWDRRKLPFEELKLPTVPKVDVNPFSYADWKAVMAKMQEKHPWYRPYFEFAVLTGLRPSEQVALKWTNVDDAIRIRRSWVRNNESRYLKTNTAVEISR